MGIPLAIFYYIYLVFVVVFLLFTLFNIYHLVRFGYLTIGNIAIVSFYLIISIIILLIAWGYITPIDWQQTIQIAPSFNFSQGL